MASIDSETLRKPLLIAGTALPSYLAGMIACFSIVAIPSVLDQPTNVNALTTWRSLYVKGKAAMPPVAVLAALVNLYSAYLHHKSSVRSAYYFAAAAVSTVAIVPYTLTVMAGNIKDLEARTATAREVDGKIDIKPTRDLIKQWGQLNFIRSLFPATGAILSYLAWV